MSKEISFHEQVSDSTDDLYDELDAAVSPEDPYTDTRTERIEQQTRDVHFEHDLDETTHFSYSRDPQAPRSRVVGKSSQHTITDTRRSESSEPTKAVSISLENGHMVPEGVVASLRHENREDGLKLISNAEVGTSAGEYVANSFSVRDHEEMDTSTAHVERPGYGRVELKNPDAPTLIAKLAKKTIKKSINQK